MSRRNPRGRDVNGVLLLDKPEGLSSNAALQRVKRLFNANKAGHTGSLDPLATGMLPLCLGEATKVSAFLLDANKRYLTTVRFGYTSSTGDAEGEIVQYGAVPQLTEADMQGILKRFIGHIVQVPPMYSALKRNGQPLYKLAYQGIEVEREPRNVEIFEITLLGLRADEADLQVRCSKGTYIRTLAEDIGLAIGCGGYVTNLRRTAVGQYDDPTQMVTIEQLEKSAVADGVAGLDHCLLPIDSALQHWPSVFVSADMAFFLRRGQSVQINTPPAYGLIKIYKGEDEFMGIGEIEEDGRLRPKRLLNL